MSILQSKKTKTTIMSNPVEQPQVTPVEPAVGLPDLDAPAPVVPEKQEVVESVEPDPEPPKRDDGLQDFASFEPEDMSEPQEEKVEEVYDPVPEVPESEAPAPDKKEGNSYLRSELKKHSARAKELEEQLEATKAEDAKELERLKAELEEKQASLEKATKQSLTPDAVVDPWETDEIKGMVDPWQKRVDSLAKTLDLTDGSGSLLRGENGNNLMKMFANVGDATSEGYDERRTEINEFLDQHFPDAKREVSALMNEGVDVWTNAALKAQEIEGNMAAYQVKAAQEAYQKQVTSYREGVEAQYGQVSEELRQTNPAHPEVIIDAITQVDEGLSERGTQIKKFLAYAQNPLPPVTEQDLSHFDTVEEKQAFVHQRQAQHDAARQQLQSQQWKWAMSYHTLQSVYKRLAAAEARLADLDAPAPSGDKAEKPKASEPSAVTDWRNFEPEPIQSPF